jgi:nitrate reductase assembly molybdenum cofactor insertion protein NarJ
MYLLLTGAKYMTIPKQPDTRTAHNEAVAWLHDTFSIAFTYPGPELIASLGNGSFVRETRQCIGLLSDPDPLFRALQAFEKVLDVLPPDLASEQLESDYLALFELNKEQPPLHLNAHLYSDDNSNPVTVYQRLIETYQSAGIEPRNGEGVEEPDHLAVQLEFQAYLYRLLAQSLHGQTDQTTEWIEATINSFRKELAWVHKWLVALEQLGGHPLYVPLGRLLWVVLDTTAPAAAD